MLKSYSSFPYFCSTERSIPNSVDENKYHGAVDESSTVLYINRLPLLCEKFGAVPLVLVGLMPAVRQNTKVPPGTSC